MDIPKNLRHKPIVGVDYFGKDAYYGDARYLSVGLSQWNPKELSAKLIRIKPNDKWARQSEELPLWRVLDLATLIVGVITGQKTSLEEEVVSPERKDFLEEFINDNIEVYQPRLEELKRLLNSNTAGDQEQSAPNIFSLATSELSQDAFLAWLIKCADDEYRTKDSDLCRVGKSFVSRLTGIPAEEVHKVAVGRQWRNIDIWAEINDDAFLTIEDKTGTTIHDKQLQRYREIVEREYAGKRRMFYAYVKTQNEPDSICNSVERSGYRVIRRADILSILDTYTGANDVMIDFRKHLHVIEDRCDVFRYQDVDKWGWHAWQGFYSELEKRIDVENWSYVPNRAGGFLGLWWHFVTKDDTRMYLQFEQSKLCIKIEYLGPAANRSAVRDKYRKRLMETARQTGIRVDRPSRVGCGTFMTIGVIPKSVVFNGVPIDLDALTETLKELERLVDNTME